MFNFLSDFLGTIVVNVDGDAFCFRSKRAEVHLKTKVCVSSIVKPIVLAVGESTPAESHVKIDLFEPGQPSLLYYEKINVLVMFFRQGFYLLKCHKARWRRIGFSPKVIFVNSESLEQILCGYQKAILRLAAMEAGARVCVFEDRPEFGSNKCAK